MNKLFVALDVCYIIYNVYYTYYIYIIDNLYYIYNCLLYRCMCVYGVISLYSKSYNKFGGDLNLYSVYMQKWKKMQITQKFMWFLSIKMTFWRLPTIDWSKNPKHSNELRENIFKIVGKLKKCNSNLVDWQQSSQMI